MPGIGFGNGSIAPAPIAAPSAYGGSRGRSGPAPAPSSGLPSWAAAAGQGAANINTSIAGDDQSLGAAGGGGGVAYDPYAAMLAQIQAAGDKGTAAIDAAHGQTQTDLAARIADYNKQAASYAANTKAAYALALTNAQANAGRVNADLQAQGFTGAPAQLAANQGATNLSSQQTAQQALGDRLNQVFSANYADRQAASDQMSQAAKGQLAQLLASARSSVAQSKSSGGRGGGGGGSSGTVPLSVAEQLAAGQTGPGDLLGQFMAHLNPFSKGTQAFQQFLGTQQLSPTLTDLPSALNLFQQQLMGQASKGNKNVHPLGWSQAISKQMQKFLPALIGQGSNATTAQNKANLATYYYGIPPAPSAPSGPAPAPSVAPRLKLF